MDEKLITILMASYQGENYLTEQIESILAQTERRWNLVIQDDCSSDSTNAIAEKYAARYPDRIQALQRKQSSGSAKANFSDMMQYVNTKYWMFCDQDDIWLRDKIEKTLAEMLSLEKENPDIPLLVHTDLIVVDEACMTIAKSFFAYQGLDFRRSTLSNLLAQNIVTGCTLMMNHALLDRMRSIPEEALMHDWWCALVAATYGKIGFLEQTTILYRQHAKNSVGAKNARSIFYAIKRGTLEFKRLKQSIDGTYLQAKLFLEHYTSDLPASAVEVCKKYVEIPSLCKVRRIHRLSEYDFWKGGVLRRIGQIFFV